MCALRGWFAREDRLVAGQSRWKWGHVYSHPHGGVHEVTGCVTRNTQEATRPQASIWEANLEVAPEAKGRDDGAQEQWLEG